MKKFLFSLLLLPLFVISQDTIVDPPSYGSIMEPVTFRLDLNDITDEIPNYEDAQVFIQTSVANWVDIPMEDIGGNGIWRKNINISHPEDENIDVFYRFKITSFGDNGLPYTMWEGGNVDTTCLFDPGTQGLAQGDIRQILFPQELIDNGTYVNPTGEYKLTHCFNECGNEPCAPEVITYDSWINIDVHTDDWPEETTWELVDSNENVIAEGGPYDLDQTLYSEIVELNSGEYYYFLFDSYGDGLWTGGYVEITNTCDSVLFFHEGSFTGNTIEEIENGAEWEQNELIESLTIAPCAPPTLGCTDEIAINFNEEAYEDDGTCEYLEGCTNENASNYDPEAAVFPSGLIFPGGSCNTTVWGQNYFGVDPDFYFNGNQDIFEVGNKLYIGENTFYVDFVAEVQGNCNAPAVLIYVCYTEAEADGNLGTFSPGLNVNAVVGEYWYMDPCTFIYGCTDPNALNFNPEAGVNDGSCINIPGCTDPTSNMYYPAATIDDGSCDGTDISCSPGKTVVTVEITLDQYQEETGWAIYDGGGTVLDLVAPGTYSDIPDYGIVEKQVCIDNGTSVLFSITDTYGDGLAGSIWGGVDGSWIVYTPCDTLSTGGGNFGPIFQENIFVQECIDEVIPGCTDSDYVEYDVYATEDDGTCLNLNVYGCTDTDAYNYDEEATSTLFTPNCDNTLTLQDWGDNGWAGSFLVVTQGDDWWGPFTLESDQLQLDTVLNLNTSEMVNTYFYSFGNSQQTAEQCRFTITNPVGLVIANGGTNPYTNPILSYNQYGFIYKAEAKCGDSCIPKIYGCLDEEAINYIATANTTDGSCYYNPGCDNEAYTEYYTYIDEYGVEADFNDGSCEEFAVFGCMDDTQFNFDYNATVNATAIGDPTDPCIPYILGCTDGTAFNYDPNANFDFDGLICEPFIYGCTDELAFNYDSSANSDNDSCIPVVYGCTEDDAFNYDIEANVDDESCIPVIEGCTQTNQFNYDPEANTDDGSCYPFVYGCLNPNSYTYNDYDNDGVGNPLTGIDGVDVNTNNNLCEPFIYGCLDETAFNYNPEANTEDENNPCEPFVYGCMDPTQFNFNINANTDDGSCIEYVYGCTDPEAFNYDELANTNVGCVSFVYGCTDPEAFNYNPQANTEDGSCEEVVIGCTDDTANNYNELANTNSGCIYPSLGCTDPEAFNFDINANVDDGSCEEVIIGCTDNTALNYDDLANTNSGCIYPILGCTDLEAFNFNVNANTDDGSCVPVIIGCTDSTANNYDETANTNSGCIYPVLGCTDPNAFNYDVNANVDDDSCEPVIIGCTDDTALNYNSSANTNSGCTYAIYGCTDPNAFNYDVNANVNNGSCIDVVIGCTDSTALNYNSNANTNNGCIYPILGCTDEEAFNYNSNANTDDGSCIPLIYGCTDNTMWNYNEEANTENGSCIEFVYGCMDSTAFNYDPTANTDNGTCIPFIYGCTDPSAFNYNVDANTEDFSCIEVVIGCTDPDAINYDPLANTDSGACIDVLTGCTDVDAYNYSFTANTDDGSCVYDAGCSGGPGVPYWLPNECFAWVISVDDECCDGEWDSFCVELYNYCDLGWPIDLQEINRELLIYPNPVTNMLTISGYYDSNVDIYDMKGQLVISKEKANSIDMSRLPAGIYNLKVLYNNKIINQRITKQ